MLAELVNASLGITEWIGHVRPIRMGVDPIPQFGRATGKGGVKRSQIGGELKAGRNSGGAGMTQMEFLSIFPPVAFNRSKIDQLFIGIKRGSF